MLNSRMAHSAGSTNTSADPRRMGALPSRCRLGRRNGFPPRTASRGKPLCVRKAGAGRPAVQPITSIVAVPIARVKYGHVLTHFYCVSGRQTTQSPPPALQHCPRHACTRSACRVLFWRAEAAQGVPVCAALVTPVPPALRHPDNRKLEGCRATALLPHPSNAGGGRPYTGSPRWAVSPGSASIMADAHAQGDPAALHTAKRLHASTAARAGNSAHPGKWFLPPSI